MNLRIATRKSSLALWQARYLQSQLQALGHASELVLIESQGDREQQAFKQMQGQGFFTKAVQDALLSQQADIAVHSYKDLPSLPLRELEVAAVSPRADPRDLLLIRPEAYDPQAVPLPLKTGVRVGTSAVRRQAQLQALRPDLQLQELRGNVPTRLGKLQRGDCEAIVIAAAGLARLQERADDDLRSDLSQLNEATTATPLAVLLAGLQHVLLEPQLFVPAPAQGVLAFECHRDAYEVASLLSDVHDIRSHKCVAAERGLMAMLQGGCQLALAAYATWHEGNIQLTAWYEGQQVSVQHSSSEGAAYLAFEALGRPAPARL